VVCKAAPEEVREVPDQPGGSDALEADAFQTTACGWLFVAALVGVGRDGLLG
jgi:hypothetical protein